MNSVAENAPEDSSVFHDPPETNIHAVLPEPGYRIHTLYKLMAEMLVMAEMQNVYKETTGRTVSDRCHILLTRRNLGPFTQGIYERFLTFPDTQSPVKPVQNWLIQSFRDLNDARKTLLRLSCEAVEPVITSVDEMKSFIKFQFAGAVSEYILIGLPEENINYPADYDLLRRSLDRIYKTLPILNVMAKFRLSIVDRIVLYFGAQNLQSLNQAQFWDQFETVEKLLEFIDESPEPLAQPRDHPGASDVHRCLLTTLIKCLTPRFKKKYNLEKRSLDVFELMNILRGLYIHEAHTKSSRKVIKPTQSVATNLSDLGVGRHGVKQQVSTAKRRRSLEDEEKEEEKKKKKKEEEEEEQKKKIKEEDYLEENRPSLDEVYHNEDMLEGKKPSVQSSSRKSEDSDGSMAFFDKGKVPERAPKQSLEQTGSSNTTIEQIKNAKQAVTDIIKNNPHWCPLCVSIGHNRDMKLYTHAFEDCPLNEMLAITKTESANPTECLTGRLLQKLREFRRLEANSYRPVYTNGVQSIKEGSNHYNSGIGVWFDDQDPGNEGMPCHAESPLETKLMAIVMALRKLQHRPRLNYEIFNDSVTACDLANGYGLPSHFDSPPREVQRLVDEAMFLKDRLLPKKIRITYANRHSPAKGSHIADDLAHEARLKMKTRILRHKQFFWPWR
ncbi:hypothetical protein B0I72DRAFT_38659 [Yarrowia lipolytica]|uniref:YALI0A16720p n=2 Tax=Yarrowia lipolytica TaxID=4952 RepID=Q6CGS3_YARLI|nr:YALI0A16720p [Yarrowia lipolytica CLIB122]AOW00736.1 hypothetical protein YALI1_A16681g [Yarrowia lipolytica]KAB8280240.1 hypothetical protein BKA91DRAFT_131011 [Yarrowia lipolytica]KAE8173969.1 hypothetical protein BKA90DRAFT_79818 [Yarrowia lipolytica]KAJ8051729.1 hypothetical protein LXG23DRAFT_51269 [Yarrowia lipolytica]QNP95451.1 Hypothetical protein YALI2_A00450g [Yarrowia lipolytica]|eukprot:XP_500139.1 YALI0A16720p [Yarrowia lipolytica CLIB122]